MIDWLIYCLLFNVLRQIFHAHSIQENRIGGVMVCMLTSSAVERGFETQSGQTKDYKIGICCFSECSSGETCLSAKCCFSELAKSSSACWSSTKRNSSSSH